jgi:hypothetical protein
MTIFRATGLLALICVLGAAPLAGCGDDDGDGAAGDGHHAGSHDGGLTGADFEMVPCPPELEEITIGLQADGQDGNYKAEIVSVSPAPPELYRNDWVIRILDLDDEPVADAEITMARPFMPAHNHDGTFQPTVSAGDGDGEFALDDLNMWMGGPWEVQVDVSGPDGTDYIVFDVCIEE